MKIGSEESSSSLRMSEYDVSIERPKYRAGRRPTAVKVYTVNHESRYLVVENVPALNLKKELLELFALYGTVEEYRYLDDYLCEEFTDVYWIKFQSIAEARVAKRKVNDHVFFGSNLKVRYGPEYESVEDTRQKLEDRRKVIEIKTQERKVEKKNEKKEEMQDSAQHPTSATQPVPVQNFPQLDPSAYNYGNYDSTGYYYSNYDPTGYYYNYPYTSYQSQEPPIPGLDHQSTLSTSFAVTSYQPQNIQSEDSQSSTVLSIRRRLKEASTVSATATAAQVKKEEGDGGKLETIASPGSRISAPEPKRRRRI
ncbi:4694_t:CDS:2 [Acaulospora morrowiae]|uniref:RNA-binding protein 48 n=1 Tax=Acaulospora morrowiae TaxID=94023 RepID=A0A9N8ZBE0_9GLOM|nr:4694_t:CDS:2 [Acaulospora morrowiae]